MCGIGKTSEAIRVVVHYPKTEEGKRELAKRAAATHADMVQQTIHHLDCPSQQKVQLLDAVIASASGEWLRTKKEDKEC